MSEKVNITAGRIADLRCPAGKAQAFLRDAKSPWLAVRVTPAGAKSFVFEAKLNGSGIREVIGSTGAWTIEAARLAANEKKMLVDRGHDPRKLRREAAEAGKAQEAAIQAKATDEELRSLLVSGVWPQYLAEGKPRRKEAWKPRYLADLHKAGAPGGEAKRRGSGVTKPGPLFSLMHLRLSQVDQDVMRDWYAVERKRGATQAARAMAMFAGFLSWCATKREYRDLVDRDAAKSSRLQDILPGKVIRTDALEMSQLPAWFAAVQRLPNKAAAAYLMALVLTGARREEMAAIRWMDVDMQWNRLTLADKVATTRTIPLTPMLKRVIRSLPVRPDNDFVFATPGTKEGRIRDPRSAHAKVLDEAGVGHCTIHGLRRSFALLAESSGTPAGAIAQIMGHRPSAMSERYKPRPIDMLRPYLTQVEVFILETARVDLDGAPFTSS